MTSIRVNIDYETELFFGNGGPVEFNQAMEFFGFFLDERSVFTQKKYDPSYLTYVQNVTGTPPKTMSEGKFINWWGELKNRELEKKLNSKITSAELVVKNQWCQNTYIIEKNGSPPELKSDITYISKNPYGMSGKSFQILEAGKNHEEYLRKSLQRNPLILEPFFNRVSDFSHYVFPDGKIVCYENLVDRKFQYKGTLFNDHTEAKSENLSFYSKVDSSEWEKFREALKIIISEYQTSELRSGFSIDSFIYEENGKNKIRFLSEVNYRRTMGSTTYELSHKYAQDYPWAMMVITKSFHSLGGFSYLQEKLKGFENVILLSPGDTRFELFLLKAKNQDDGLALLKKLNLLLPHGQFSIEL